MLITFFLPNKVEEKYDSIAGANEAAKIPCKALKKIMLFLSIDIPNAMVITVKMNKPTMTTLLLPYRSARAPQKRKPNA